MLIGSQQRAGSKLYVWKFLKQVLSTKHLGSTSNLGDYID